MKTLSALLMFVLGTALIQAQSYEKFYFYKKSVGGVNKTVIDYQLTTGFVKLNYNDSTIVITLHEDDVIHIDCHLNQVYEQTQTDDYLKIKIGLKWVKTYHGKTPTNEDIIMIQWASPNNENGIEDEFKYAYTFIIDGVETLFYCSERYVKESNSDKLIFYKLKEW